MPDASDETTTITVDQPVVTLINVFTVEPDRQQELAEMLTRATDDVMRQQPGFVSANIHVSSDGTRVTNYAQWADEAAFGRMRADAECRDHMAACGAVATSFEPHLYTVASTHHA